jgi:enoyl-CoA hydratase
MSICYEGFDELKVELTGRLLRITLSAPPLNPISNRMQRELCEALKRANTDARVKVVVLTGAGKGFSAGGNIQEMQDKARDINHHIEMMANGVDLVHSLIGLAKPCIARINGHAIGLGATIALLCDITIASNGAKIGDPHVKLGLTAGDGGALIWPLLIGISRAKEFLLTGRLMTAQEAATIGLINYAVPEAELDEKVAEFTRYFEAGPSIAINSTKVALNQSLQQYAITVAEAHMGLEGRSIFSDDHQEAVNAFIENREPRFK